MTSLRAISDTDRQGFARLCAGDRLEAQTCRAIVEGKPTRDPHREDWSYVLDDGTVAGWITLFDLNPRNRSAELGFGLIPDCRGRGHARRMLASGFDQLFATMDLNKLHCQTASFNVASVRTLEALGMTRDAVLREHHELDGVLHDAYVYSMLEREWRRRAGRAR